MRRIAAIGVVLALAAGEAWTQPLEVPRKVVLYFESSLGQEATREDFVYLYETLVTRLAREPLAVLVPASIDAPQSDEARKQQALERGAEGWVRVTVTRTAEDWRLGVSWMDLLGGETAVTERGFSRPDLADLEGAFWDEAAEAIAAAFTPVEQKLEVASGRRGEVTVKALAGTTVRGLGEEPLEIGSDGTGRIELTRPGFYRIEATKAGSLPVREVRYLAVVDTVWEIVQKPAPQWMFEAYTLNASYLGGSFGELFGSFYLRLGLTTYLIAPWLRNENDEERDATLPLTDLVAAFGYLPLGPDAPVRPYADIAVIVRVSLAGGTVAVEPVAPLGCRAAAGVEVLAGPGLRLFADYGPVFYDVHASEAAVVDATLTVNGDRSSGYFYKPWWGGVLGGVLIDLVGFRLGVRWYK